MRPERADRDRRDLRDRLARAEQETGRSSGAPTESDEQILERRARALARVPLRPPDAAEVVEVLTFTIGGERLAIEASRVRGVARLSSWTPIPGAPDGLVGVVNVRGDILALFDLRRLIGIVDGGEREPSRIVVLGTDRDEFGVLADEVDEVTALRLDQISEPPGAIAGGGPRLVRGLTDDAMVVLDGEALLRDERFVVDQSDEAAP